MNARDDLKLEPRETPSVSVFDTATLHEFADGTSVVSAGVGGGPRVDVYRNDTPVAAFFAFENSFRGGVNVDYDAGTLLVGPGWGGGPVEKEYRISSSGVTLVRCEMMDDPTARLGWSPSLPAAIPFEQHPTRPLTDHYILDTYERDLNRVPREIQRQLLDAGITIVVHSAPHLVLDSDGVPHRTFYDPNTTTIYLGYGGGLVHEIGHAVGHVFHGGDLSEEFAERFVNEIYFGVPS